PDASGLDILRHVRARDSAIPFILITGIGTIKDSVTAIRYGANDVLEKPVFEDELLRTVRRVLLGTDSGDTSGTTDGAARLLEAHAAARLARALIPVIAAPKDPRTISG